MVDLAGRSVAVVGGGNGIGAATARRLAEDGAAVLVADIDGPAARAVAAAVTGAGGRALAVRTDGTDPASVAELVEVATERYGGLDAAVHSVYVDRRAPVVDLSRADWSAVVDAGLGSAYLLARAAVPALSERGGGSLVFVSSVEARFGFRGHSAYAAAKAGLSGLARQLAVEYGPAGVRVNVVLPSFVLTERERAAFTEEPDVLARLARTFPLRRAGRPEDVAAAIAFLTSDDASFITGTDLLVDGGISVQSATHWARDPIALMAEATHVAGTATPAAGPAGAREDTP